MASLVDTLTFDRRDPQPLVGSWCAALGYVPNDVDSESAEIRDPKHRGWPILFLVVPEGKTVKNRVHHPPRERSS